MKSFKYILLIISLFSLASCVRDPEVFDVEAQWELEKQVIRTYISKNYPEAIEHKGTGIWYQVIADPDPQADGYEYRFNTYNNDFIYPFVTVNYKLRLLESDQIVDENKDGPSKMSLSHLVGAWKIAFFPKFIGERRVDGLLANGLQIGNKIRLFTPSRYGYGNFAQNGIPANSPLFFEIEVLDVTDE